MNRYNELAFTPEEIEKGMLKDFLDYVQEYNNKRESGYMDVHLLSDGYCQIVQFIDRGFEDYDTGKFAYVDSNQHVMTECMLPDNSIIMCYDEEEAKEHLDEFLKEHPTYKKNEYGMWVDESGSEQLRLDLQLEQTENKV